MEKPVNLTKLYYTIGEVSIMFNVNQSLLRYWDKEFPSLKLKKTRKGDRRFTKEDIYELTKIYNLVKEKGYTIDGARNQLNTGRKTENSKESLNDLLLRLKSISSGLKDIRENLE